MSTPVLKLPVFNLRRENLSARALASAPIYPKDILLKGTLATVPIQLRLGVLEGVPKPKQNGNRRNTCMPIEKILTISH